MLASFADTPEHPSIHHPSTFPDPLIHCCGPFSLGTSSSGHKEHFQLLESPVLPPSPHAWWVQEWTPNQLTESGYLT